MLSIPNSFMVGSTYCYPVPNDPASFYCLPNTPTIDRDEQDRPILMLITNGSQHQLQMSVRWTVPQNELAQLPQEIIRRFPALRPEIIRLINPMVEVTSVNLLLGDGQGDLTPIGSFRSSGMPPFSTVIKLPLTEQQKGAVIAALQKRPGFLSIQYEIALPHETSATTTIQGHVEAELAQFRMKTFIMDPSRNMIAQALAAGRLIQTSSTVGLASEQLKDATIAGARDKAAQALLQLSRNAGNQEKIQLPSTVTNEGTLNVSASKTETVRLELFPTADVSSWFQTATEITDHLLIQPGGGSTPVASQSSTSVALGFDAFETPINFILLRQETEQATLKGPSFAPVAMRLTAGEPLEITTHYTDGGPPFSHTLKTSTAEELQIGPAEAGLAAITVDANALAEAGLKSARIHIRYVPDSDGSEDDRTIHLRSGEWSSTWYVVSRATTLAGNLRYECKMTAANGTFTNTPTEKVTTTTITLQSSISDS